MAQDTTALIRRAREGGREAREALLKTCGTRVQNLAYQILGNVEDARDLAQDALLRLLLGLKSYDVSRPFDAWLRRLVVNLAIDRRRAAARAPRQDDTDIGATLPGREQSPDSLVETGELRGALARICAGLPERQCLVFILRDIQDFSCEEIAEVLGLKPPTVRVHLARARLRIRDQLKKLYPERMGGAR